MMLCMFLFFIEFYIYLITYILMLKYFDIHMGALETEITYINT